MNGWPGRRRAATLPPQLFEPAGTPAPLHRGSVMSDAVAAFIDWVVQTPLSLFIQSELWVIPALQTVHILCVAIVLSAAAMLDLKLLGFLGHGQSLVALTRRFLPPAWIA